MDEPQLIPWVTLVRVPQEVSYRRLIPGELGSLGINLLTPPYYCLLPYGFITLSSPATGTLCPYGGHHKGLFIVRR